MGIPAVSGGETSAGDVIIDLPPFDIWVFFQHMALLLGVVSTFVSLTIQIRSLNRKLNGHLDEHRGDAGRRRP